MNRLRRYGFDLRSIANYGEQYGDDFLENLRRSVISACDSNSHEAHYDSTEKRVFGFEKVCSEGSEFLDLSASILREYGIDRPKDTLLAIKNEPIAYGRDEHHKGRWHIDSFRSQFKVFLFLSDVSADAGPLAVVPKSHYASFKAKSVVTGKYYNPFSKDDPRLYRRLSDQQYDDLAIPLIVPKGTIAIVNTSCVHRATPCVSKTRVALTSYFV